jgi:sugar lactone lactonase YvrE
VAESVPVDYHGRVVRDRFREIDHVHHPNHSVFRVVLLMALLACAGCGRGGKPDLVWGQRGLKDGDFVRPRAVAIGTSGERDELYMVDFSGRIQVFTTEGEFLRSWATPTIANGRPAGLGWGRDGTLLVADSHYSRLLIYSPEGKLLREISSRAGEGPGPMAYVSDVAQDEDGNFYITEFGDEDRIRKLSPDGRYVKRWGSHGSEPGQLSRPRALALGPDGLLYVADNCNHRIQAFTRDGELVRIFGRHGSGPGELSYPYDLTFDREGYLLVVEYGNHRVQRFTREGELRGTWGSAGREPGALHSPWGVAVDRRGRVYVLDTENHRVQRFGF